VSNYKLRYWQPGDLGSNEDDLEGAVTEYTKYVLFMLEGMIGKMKQRPVPQKFIVLFDLRGFSVSLIFRKDVRLMIRKLIYIAQAQYPERLHKALLVNAPMGFESAWTLIRALLDEKTASKVSFLNLKSLQKEIDADVLSVEYGGNHDEYPLPGGTI
jgi:CRAL/TRIO domain